MIPENVSRNVVRALRSCLAVIGEQTGREIGVAYRGSLLLRSVAKTGSIIVLALARWEEFNTRQ